MVSIQGRAITKAPATGVLVRAEKYDEGPPVDELAEGRYWPGPVSAVGLRAGPETSLRVWLIPVGVLIILSAGPALSLDRIDDVLPGERRRDRHIDYRLEVSIASADV